MKFSSESVAFGRHETFQLRFAWLSKGFAALKHNPKLFESTDEATVVLGVGKNMVHAIRYWMMAAGFIDPKTNHTTTIGQYIFDPDSGEDPFLEDQGTLWLVHWLLSSNPATATSVAWFFSKYHKTYFDQSELRAALSMYLQESVKSSRRPAVSTLKNDISVLMRLYAKTPNSSVAEDSLDSPLSELGLVIEHGKNSYTSEFDEHVSLPSEILGFAILQLMGAKGSKIIPLEELMQSAEDYVSPGSVFRLNETAFMVKIEDLVRTYPDNFVLRETAGLRQFFINEPIDEMTLLEDHYEKHSRNIRRVA